MAFAIASVIVASALFAGCHSAEAATAEPNPVRSIESLPDEVLQTALDYCDGYAMCHLSETNQASYNALEETKRIREEQEEELQVLQIFRGLIGMIPHQSMMSDEHTPDWYQFVAESIESFDVLPLSSTTLFALPSATWTKSDVRPYCTVFTLLRRMDARVRSQE